MTQPTLYILDDHPVVAEGLAQLLATEKKYCITTGHHYSELYQYITHTIPDLLILDYELHDKTALDVLAYLRKKRDTHSGHCIYHAYGVLDYQASYKRRSIGYRHQKRQDGGNE